MHLQFGNLLNEDFIVLKEKCSNEMKKLINNRKERIEYCTNCDRNKECGKGCVAFQINANNKLKGMDEVCPKIRKEVLGIECS